MREGVTLRHEVTASRLNFDPAPTPRDPELLNGRSEEFQCDVVRVTAGQTGTVISIDDATVGDIDLLGPDHPWLLCHPIERQQFIGDYIAHHVISLS